MVMVNTGTFQMSNTQFGKVDGICTYVYKSIGGDFMPIPSTLVQNIDKLGKQNGITALLEKFFISRMNRISTENNSKKLIFIQLRLINQIN